MSTTPLGPQGRVRNENLNAALRACAEREAGMTPREKDSLDAAPAISFVLSNMIAHERNTLHTLNARRESLESLQDALLNPETTEHHLGMRIRMLSKADCEKIEGRVRGYIADVKLLISTAGPV